MRAFFIALSLAACMAIAQDVVPSRRAAFQSGCAVPNDDMQTYSALASLGGLNGGCGFGGAYAVTTYENIPGVVSSDTIDTYSAGAGVTGLSGGINWFASPYVAYTYEDIPVTNYVDAISELSAGNDLTLGTFKGGTNYFATQVTNTFNTVQAWTNAYAAKGF